MAINTGRMKPKKITGPIRVAETTPDTAWWATPGGSQTSKVGESRGTTPAVPSPGMAGTSPDFGSQSGYKPDTSIDVSRPKPNAGYYSPLSNAIANQVMGDAATLAQGDAANYMSENDALAALIQQIYGSTSGGGGGSGSSAQALALRNMRGLAEMLAQQLSSGSYKEPYQRLNKRLGRQYRGARKDIRDEYARLEEELRGLQTNPYQDFAAESGVAQPGLMDYLSQMGGDTSGLQGVVSAEQAAAQQQAAAFNNIARMMAAQQAASNTGRLADVAQSRTGNIADLLAQRSAYGAGIRTQEEAARQSLYQLLSQLGLQGVDIGGLL